MHSLRDGPAFVSPYLRHQRRTQSLRLFQIGEARALAGNDIACRRASVDPDRARTFHEESAILEGDAALIDGAFWCASCTARGFSWSETCLIVPE